MKINKRKMKIISAIGMFLIIVVVGCTVIFVGKSGGNTDVNVNTEVSVDSVNLDINTVDLIIKIDTTEIAADTVNKNN